jgi:hypothetical protein
MWKIEVTDSKIGETLVESGYMSSESVEVVLLRQKFGDSRLFGQIATSLNFLTEDNLSKCLKH